MYACFSTTWRGQARIVYSACLYSMLFFRGGGFERGVNHPRISHFSLVPLKVP